MHLSLQLFRHGHRTPADTYPNDPHINETFYPYGWGHLTNEGKRYLFESGEYLRRRYNTFLGKTYFPDMVHSQSTGVARTRMSLQLVLAGLFPPKNTANEWNKRLNWQPVPIESEPLDKDTLLLVRTECPRYHEALEEALTSDPIKSEIDVYRPMMEELTKITGLNITTPDDIQSLYSTLRTEEEYGLRLPAWTREYYPYQLFEVTTRSYLYNVWTDELKRLKGGPFVSKIVKEWQDKVSDTLKPAQRKIYMYTGHDSSVVNILSAFNVWEEQFPGYAIMSIFELLQDKTTGEYGVQLYLRNSTSSPTPLTIPGCDFFCPLDKVMGSVQHLIKPIDTATECKAKNDGYVPPEVGGP